MKSVDSRPAFEHPRLTVPTTLSDLPTIPNKVDLDRTLPMEPVVLAQLCAQTQISERRRVLPRGLEYSLQVLPGVELPPAPVAVTPPGGPPELGRAAQQAAVQRRQTILLIVGPFLGLSLGMSVAWKLDLGRPRAPRPELAAHSAPRVTATAPGAEPAAAPPPGSAAPPVNAPTTMMPTWSAALPLNGPPATGAAGNAALNGPAAIGAAGNAALNGPAATGAAGNAALNGPAAIGAAGNAALNGSAAIGAAGNAALNGSAATGAAGNAVLPLNAGAAGSAGHAALTPAALVAVPSSRSAAAPLRTAAGSAAAAPAAAPLDWEPLLVVAPARGLAHPGKPPLTSGRKLPARAGAHLGVTPAVVSTGDDEREAQRPAELPASEPPHSESSSIPAKPVAGARPASRLDYALKPTPLLGNQQPVLPVVVRQMYQHEAVVGNYRVCVQPSGSVSSVTAVTGIPFDDEIRRTLHSWRFAPRATPTCMEEELHFVVE